MKKLFIIFAAALLSISANAQLFVGGNVSVSTSSDKIIDQGTSQTVSNFKFSIAPEIGYNISDKAAVGATLNLTPGSRKDIRKDSAGNSKESLASSFSWSISPYVRAKFWGIHKFGIWGQANVYFGTSSSKPKDYAGEVTPYLNWGINILPVLTYSLNEHFVLDAYIDCLSLGYSGTSFNNKSQEYKTVNNTFDLGIASTGQILGIGFHYIF